MKAGKIVSAVAIDNYTSCLGESAQWRGANLYEYDLSEVEEMIKQDPCRDSK